MGSSLGTFFCRCLRPSAQLCSWDLGVCHGTHTYPPVPVTRHFLLSDWVGLQRFSGLGIPQVQDILEPNESLHDFIERMKEDWDKENQVLNRGEDRYVLKLDAIETGVRIMWRQGEDGWVRDILYPVLGQPTVTVGSTLTLQEFIPGYLGEQLNVVFTPNLKNEVQITHQFHFRTSRVKEDNNGYYEEKEKAYTECSAKSVTTKNVSFGAGQCLTRFLTVLAESGPTKTIGKGQPGMRHLTCMATFVGSPLHSSAYNHATQTYKYLISFAAPLPLVRIPLDPSKAETFLPPIAKKFYEYIESSRKGD
mmetsp:Transcript_5387/g.15202  ORF Transcript_5387/g.15202 Transcript_5387/m.15202 type:complete len:307 (-) Transcript_5387:934-1854(-)